MLVAIRAEPPLTAAHYAARGIIFTVAVFVWALAYFSMAISLMMIYAFYLQCMASIAVIRGDERMLLRAVCVVLHNDPGLRERLAMLSSRSPALGRAVVVVRAPGRGHKATIIMRKGHGTARDPRAACESCAILYSGTPAAKGLTVFRRAPISSN